MGDDKKKDKKRKKKKDKEKDKKDKKKSKHEKKKSSDGAKDDDAKLDDDQTDKTDSLPPDNSGENDIYTAEISDPFLNNKDADYGERSVIDKLNENERRITEKENKPVPGDEEAVPEDVLIITTDKSLVDELEPSESDRKEPSNRMVVEEKERDKMSAKEEKEKMLPFPPSRWEEDSEEDDDDDDDDNSLDSKKNLPLGTDRNKRSENAIFRRAISAIKPKHIEIKLRPERRVFVDSANVEKEADAEEMKKVAADPIESGKTRGVKLNPVVDSGKVDCEEKKKSVRERLGDKVEPEVKNDDKVKEAKKPEKDKSKDKIAKKDKRRSPSKDKERDKKDKEKRSRTKEKEKKLKHKDDDDKKKDKKRKKKKKEDGKLSSPRKKEHVVDKVKQSKIDEKPLGKYFNTPLLPI